MISADVRMLDLNPQQWRRLYKLVFAEASTQLIIMQERTRILKAFDTRRGVRTELKTEVVDDPRSLAAGLHAREQVDQVLVLEGDVVDEVVAVLHELYDTEEDGDRYFQRAREALDDNPGIVQRRESMVELDPPVWRGESRFDHHLGGDHGGRGPNR